MHSFILLGSGHAPPGCNPAPSPAPGQTRTSAPSSLLSSGSPSCSSSLPSTTFWNLLRLMDLSALSSALGTACGKDVMMTIGTCGGGAGQGGDAGVGATQHTAEPRDESRWCSSPRLPAVPPPPTQLALLHDHSAPPRAPPPLHPPLARSHPCAAHPPRSACCSCSCRAPPASPARSRTAQTSRPRGAGARGCRRAPPPSAPGSVRAAG